MSKTISAQLLADIQKNVTTTAICITITRRDGKTIRITNHDQALTFGGYVYDHTVPFSVGAIDSGSQMATDNVDLTLFIDDTVLTMDHIRNGLYDYAECVIFFVDYENPTHGQMTVRRGWFGQVEHNRNNTVTITVTGLLKVLDFETGRIYQPTCDADFGDRRCKVAVNPSQVYSPRNEYYAGDWVYYMDDTLMTALTVVNPGFEVDGGRSTIQPITGWTRGDGAAVFVNAFPQGISATPTAVAGTYALFSGTDVTANDSGFENYVYQDIDLITAGLTTTDIDNGIYSLLYRAAVSQNVYTLDPLKLLVELLDANGEIVSTADSGWIFLDTFDVWRDRAVYIPIYPNTRTVRIHIRMRKEDGAVANCGADDVRLHYWNHTAGHPWNASIHKASRIVAFGEEAVSVPKNPSFEANGAVANALSPTITNWVTTGSWWQVDNNVDVLTAPHGSFALVGGSDGTLVQKTYTATQNVTLASMVTLDSARLALGKYVGQLRLSGIFGDAGLTKATVVLQIYNSVSALLDTITLYSNNAPGAQGFLTLSGSFTVPPTAHSFTITLQVHTPVGSGDGSKVGFDNLRFFFYDAEKPVLEDPVTDDGVTTTVFNTVQGSYTVDSGIIWKALEDHITYDSVASVVSNKEFITTLLSGDAGTFETGYVWWVSGANAGLKTPIRTWTPGTSTLKLYFREPNPIQIGDRFIAVRTCQRRFVEDCVEVFQNGINFRGFPHLPGKLTDEDVAAETA